MTENCFRHHIKMEYEKITNLLYAKSDNLLGFITKKYIEDLDMSGNADDSCKPSKQIRFRTSMLQSDLCDYSDAYIVVKGTINIADPNYNTYDKKLALKNNASLISCISKIKNPLIDNAEDLDIVVSIYSLNF